ncbi:uncharacterized protein LOC117519691 [Thalassophryne amazonica]|uniref:uncharacterized protein LOC117519691 n=1 Tax=Thalassophryne amazonica TaxID=390379 RepID=UPI001471EEA7|nr:uncharacterized protein LOC117519691 [Thalassophryne amazonica]
MIRRLFALCLLRTVSLIQTPESPQQISWTVAEVGGSVNLSCPFDVHANRLFAWYKQSPGFMIQTVILGSYGTTTFLEQFDNSRFAFTKGDGHNVLHINNIQKEDEASYLCLSLTAARQTFVNGTFLAVNDSRMKSFSVKQNPETELVHLGASVNLQCSLFSKNKGKRIPCPGEPTVHWFRAASGEPHPGYIYSDGHTSAECEERSCIYSLSKTIQNPSDSGTYYCAVVTCGKILFGQGTTIQITGIPGGNAGGQHALNRAAVEGHLQFLLQVVFPEYSQEVESLLGLIDYVVGVDRPREVLCDVYAQELEGRNPLQVFPINVKGLHC